MSRCPSPGSVLRGGNGFGTRMTAVGGSGGGSGSGGSGKEREREVPDIWDIKVRPVYV